MDELMTEIASIFNQRQNAVVVCLGNELRGDDGVGIEIGKAIQDNIVDTVILAHNVPANFIGKIAKLTPDLLLFIDAVEADIDPGNIIIFTPHDEQELVSFTTHYQEATVLLTFLERELERLPEIHYIGVQIADTAFMSNLSKNVEEAMNRITTSLLQIRGLNRLAR